MSLPTRIDARVDAGEARRWRLVRLDTFADIEGEIVWADRSSGSYCMRRPDNAVIEHCLGANGLAIVPRRR